MGPKHSSLDPFGLGRKIPSRPTPLGLGRQHRLARTPWASDASSVSPDPSRARAPTSLRPIPRHGTRLPMHDTHTHDVTGAVTSISWQGMVVTIPTTPASVALPLFTMQPHLFYCDVPPHSKRGMGEINQRHYLLSSPTVNRTSNSITDPTPTTPTGLGNPPQEQPCCQPCLKDGMGELLQGRDCGFTTQQGKSPIKHVNARLPLRL